MAELLEIANSGSLNGEGRQELDHLWYEVVALHRPRVLGFLRWRLGRFSEADRSDVYSSVLENVCKSFTRDPERLRSRQEPFAVWFSNQAKFAVQSFFRDRGIEGQRFEISEDPELVRSLSEADDPVSLGEQSEKAVAKREKPFALRPETRVQDQDPTLSEAQFDDIVEWISREELKAGRYERALMFRLWRGPQFNLSPPEIHQVLTDARAGGAPAGSTEHHMEAVGFAIEFGKRYPSAIEYSGSPKAISVALNRVVKDHADETADLYAGPG